MADEFKYGLGITILTISIIIFIGSIYGATKSVAWLTLTFFGLGGIVISSLIISEVIKPAEEPSATEPTEIPSIFDPVTTEPSVPPSTDPSTTEPSVPPTTTESEIPSTNPSTNPSTDPSTDPTTTEPVIDIYTRPRNYTLLYKSGTSNGNMGNRENIDLKCEQNMPDNCINGTSHGFISVSQNDSIKDMKEKYGYGNGPIVSNPISVGQGKIIANSWDEMMNGDLKMTLGNALGISDKNWWSGSNPDGTLNSKNCSNWGTNEDRVLGIYGSLTQNEVSNTQEKIKWIDGSASSSGNGFGSSCYITSYANLCACSIDNIKTIEPEEDPIEPVENPDEPVDPLNPSPTDPVPTVPSYIDPVYDNQYTKIYSAGMTTGNMGSRNDIDTKCKLKMPSECNPNTAHGFISVSENDSIKNMPNNYGYDTNKQIIGKKEGGYSHIIANNWESLLDGTIDKTLRDTIVGDNYRSWWTGSNEYGEYSGINCSGWTTTNGTATSGNYDYTDIKWINNSDTLKCSNTLDLLCACSVDKANVDPVPIPPNTGDNILYSIGTTNSNMHGREGIDHNCNRDDLRPSVCAPGSAHGFISVNYGDSIKNMPNNYGINVTKQIKNKDGEQIATNWNDLLSKKQTDGLSDLLINTHPFYQDLYWSGSNDDGSTNLKHTCEGWTTTDGGAIMGSMSGYNNNVSWLNIGNLDGDELAAFPCTDRNNEMFLLCTCPESV